jgi:hypothetical protein
VCVWARAQWSAGGQISTIYFVYRLAAAAVLVIWVVCDFLDEAGRWYSFDYGLWFIFATNWSMVALVVTAVMMAISTTYYYIRTRCQKRGNSKRRKPSNVYENINVLLRMLHAMRIK